jgi:L-amino acid N-acyltransferase YncA
VATPADGAAIASIYAPYVADTPISFETQAPDADEMSRRIATGSISHPWLIAEAREPLGYAYGSAHRTRAAYAWAVDVSVYVASDNHGMGIGRRLYECLLELLRLQGYFTAFAGLTLPNEASEGLHAALGFEPVGVYRNVGQKAARWYDVAWVQKQLRAPAPNPAPPLSVAKASRLPEWQAILSDAGSPGSEAD